MAILIVLAQSSECSIGLKVNHDFERNRTVMHRLFNTTALLTMTVLVIGCGKSEGPKGDENGKQGKSIDQSTPEKVLQAVSKLQKCN